ncbi:MAG: GcrA cell cycle regulator, partial [Rhodobacteraceae bacterium]|nr:GcrA cell cycle regulator [Paracoccaceae bacterium]
MSWTDERVETLKKMWAEGQSASQIAKELGGVTRNAVIGKVHRLGLSNRVGGAPEPAKDRADQAPKLDAKPAVAAKPAQPTAKPAQSTAAPAAVRPDPAPAQGQPGQRKPVVPAGQPLPPQPSAGEISPEALASVREIEKRARRLTLMELTERTC